MRLRPTGVCFEDASRFLRDVASAVPDAPQFIVTHARCSLGAKHFAHAYVTDPDGGIWQCALEDSPAGPRRVYYGLRRVPFEVHRAWAYSPEDLASRIAASGHHGPWVPELIELCAPLGAQSIVGAVDVPRRDILGLLRGSPELFR